MGYVNTGLSVLLEALTNIQKALNSIESTKVSMSRKYQLLGNAWHDRKYRELGDVIQECGRSMDHALRNLTRAAKTVSALAHILREYEETSLRHTGVERGGESTGFSWPNPPGRPLNTSEKHQFLKNEMRSVNEIIENYAQALESRGMERGPAMDAFLRRQRFMMEAEALHTLNGDFSYHAPVLTGDDFDAVARQYRANTANAELTPRSLAVTEYGFTTQVVNGTEMRVYDDPVGTASRLIQKQGNSHFPMEGTCGLCQCANLLIMAGVGDASEDSVISAALHASDSVLEDMELFNPSQDERGGTTTDGRQEILFRCGLPTQCVPVSYDRSETTRTLSEAIRTGHGVIVSVDVARLWRNGQRGGHAISLISVSEDGGTFIYSDTGMGCVGTISAEDLARALTGRPANITTDVIR